MIRSSDVGQPRGEILKTSPLVRSASVRIPLHCDNPLNGSWHHWSVKAAQRKKQRAAVQLAMRMHSTPWPVLPVTVKVTRYGPRRLDSWDGLPASLKAVVDAVADAYGCRDDDARFTWLQPGQEKGEYGVVIEIEARDGN